jgi:hypothetical protein
LLFTFFLSIFRLGCVTVPYLEIIASDTSSLRAEAFQRVGSSRCSSDALGPVGDAQALTSNFWNTAKFFGIEVLSSKH